MTDPGLADRLKLADQLDRGTRLILFGVVAIALIGAVDLLTGWFLGNALIDIVLIVGAGMCLSGAYSGRRLAQRLRAGDLPPRPSVTQLAWSLMSTAATLGFIAAAAYYIGGWVLAVVVLSATIATTAVAAAIGIRRRRRSPAQLNDHSP